MLELFLPEFFLEVGIEPLQPLPLRHLRLTKVNNGYKREKKRVHFVEDAFEGTGFPHSLLDIGELLGPVGVFINELEDGMPFRGGVGGVRVEK